jgi:hypothetical protein
MGRMNTQRKAPATKDGRNASRPSRSCIDGGLVQEITIVAAVAMLCAAIGALAAMWGG